MSDLVSVFLDHVNHIDRHHHRNPQLGELGGQIQVALKVGAVNDVQNSVGTLARSGSFALPLPPRYKGKGINTRQVYDHNVSVLFRACPPSFRP